ADPQAGLTVRYSSPDRPGTSVRRIRPVRIETDGARSYLLADCELAGDRRRFRLDRIVQLPGDDAVPHRADPGPGPDLGVVVDQEVWVRLDPPAHWIAESFGAAELRDDAEGRTYARIDRPVRSALVDAVFEAADSAEVIGP